MANQTSEVPSDDGDAGNVLQKERWMWTGYPRYAGRREAEGQIQRGKERVRE